MRRTKVVEEETCYYCDKKAIYNDASKDRPWRIIGVCEKHFTNYSVS